jgi:hypothetical protein
VAQRKHSTMNKIIICIVAWLSQAIFVSASSIISVSVPANSLNANCRPTLDSILSATTPIDVDVGIGVIVNPALASTSPSNFALHQNDVLAPSAPRYSAANVPTAAYNKISYTFDRPTIISGVRIFQHSNGITRVQGDLGNAPNSLTSLGNVFGPAGDITNNGQSNFVVANDGDAQDFLFNNTTVSGTNFELTITKTVYASAYASFRIIPLDENGVPIPVASGVPLIVSISIPANSQGTNCRPYQDNLWSVSNPIDPDLGIGVIINPSLPSSSSANYALHQNDALFPSAPSYIAANVPNAASATVSYVFSEPAIVSGVRIVQHLNGITRVQGALGNSSGTPTNLGNVFGPSGDITNNGQSNFVVANDGDSQDFLFGNTTVAGTHFDLTITKTVYASAFAAFRIIPLDENGVPIPTIVTAPLIISVSVPSNSLNANCRPTLDNLLSATTPINVGIGIGVIVNPVLPSTSATHFALHQNDVLAPSAPRYSAANVPNATYNKVSYTFDRPTVVSGVRIYQHSNGITRVQGSLGSSSSSLTTLGNVFGPAGDITNNGQSNFVVANDGDAQDFFFGNTTIAGEYFELVITKTVYASAYAAFRIIPLDQYGDPINIAP